MKRKLSPPHPFFKEFEKFYNIKTIDRAFTINRFLFYSSISLKYSLSKNSVSVIPAPSQNRFIVITFEHFVLPFMRSYIADGDIPPFRDASQMFIFFSLQISSAERHYAIIA